MIDDYEMLLDEADQNGLVIKEKPLQSSDGLIAGKRIALRRDMSKLKKSCVLAEELGHYHKNYGDIRDQSTVWNRKQESLARAWAYDRMIGLDGFVRAFEHGCQSLYDTAEYLNVTEEFLSDAMAYYKRHYGICVSAGDYMIYFEPCLMVGSVC